MVRRALHKLLRALMFLSHDAGCRHVEAVLEVEALTKRFDRLVAADRVTFSLARGEVLGFLGPNGAGKSTTMRMIAGFLPPTSGTARVCGHDVVTAPIAARRALGYLPEGAPLYGEMTPAGLLDFVARARGFRGAAKASRVSRAVERLELERVLHQPIDTLSKGFRRRVGLAQAILHEPGVLILDEPTDGLDPNQKRQVRALLRELSANTAIVVSTHILEEVEAVCSRAIVIAGGRVVVDSTPSELAARGPLDEVFHALTRPSEAAAAEA
ncbi:ABC transporter ATP-binding protein [Ferruginivarius sediminum]|uniref:ABC transporter ATP-binding protein n=1 Tax=Ferruginivarius sediminum TaxID=2661937 RepID=UPI001F4E391F|nr:ABC transporter ATP-binding protein [Ferruginivarius sediminum]